MIRAVIRKIYAIIPLKKELFLVLRIFWRPPERIYKHLHFTGVFTLRINSQTSFKMKNYGHSEETQLFWVGLSGCWERQSMKIWIALCDKARIIFDVGANTGVYALMAGALNPQARIYALEPVKRVFQKLEENVQLNRFPVRCICKAASNFSGRALIYDTPADHVYSVTVNKNRLPEGTEAVVTEIETITLAALIETEKLLSVDLLKIDVETHEAEVLEGLKPYLALHLPTLIIEILNNEVAEQVARIFHGLPYLYFNIDENREIRNVPALTKSDYYNFLICTREVAEYLKSKGILSY